MKHYKDYFKSRKQVEEYFGKEVFKFHYMCDNAMHFESLNPVMMDEGLFSFELSFYFDDGNDFFCYSSFEDWFEKFQLSSVTIKNEATNEYENMFFRTYVDYRDN